MGALRITSVEDLDAADWDHAWSSSPTATWFQSRAWAESWCEFSRGKLRPEAKRIVFSDGASACVPMCVQRGRFLRFSGFPGPGGAVATHVSPGGTAGGWITEAALGKEHAERLTTWLIACPGLVWRVNPFDPLAQDATSGIGDDSDPTWLLSLSEGFESVHRSFSKGHRSAARRAEREGVHVEPASGEADWKAYLSVYAESVARWGRHARTVYPPRFFEILRARCGDAMRLWVARDGAAVVAGALAFEAPAHTAYWHGAMRSDSPRQGAVHLLLRTMIENACDEGVGAFDFNPSGGLAGVQTFKKGFGAHPRPCPVVRTPAPTPHAWLARLFARGRGR
jgi:hypothetical protein